MSQVEIVVTARNNANAGLRAAAASVATLSSRLRDARMRAAQLAAAEREAVAEVQRLDRVVRFFGSAATEEMRNNLAQAQIRVNDLRTGMANVDAEVRDINRHMGQANIAAAAFSVHIRNADREMERLNRQFNRLDNRIRRNIGARIDRLGDSIRQVAGAALANGIETVSAGLQAAARNVVLFAAAAPAVAGLGVVVAGVLGNLTGLVSVLPAAVLAGAASLMVFKLGLKGVSEAFSAGLSGDAEKFREALKGLNVHAQEFVKAGVNIVNAWKPLQRVVQAHLFRGMATAFKDVNSVIQPLAERWLPKIASLFSQAGQGIAGFFKSAGTSGQLDTIMDGVWRNIDGVLKSIPFLMQAFTDIGEVGASMFGDLGQGIGSMAERFANWIRELRDNGTLQEWADKAKEAFNTLGRIAGDVGRVIAAVFRNGSDEGQTFLENIEAQTERWATFMESADGARLVDSLGAIGAAMGHLVGVIQFLSEVWLGWVAIYESGIQFISNGWNQMVQMAISAVGAILGALVAMLGWIPGIGDRLRQSQRDFEAWRNASVSSLNSTQGAVAGVQNSINNMHGKTVYIDVVQRGPSLGGSGGYRGLASGGIATGMKWVGERGPELVDFGARGGKVKNAGQSREAARAGGGGATQVNINVSAGSGSTTFTDFLLGEIRHGRIKLTVNSGGRVAVA